MTSFVKRVSANVVSKEEVLLRMGAEISSDGCAQISLTEYIQTWWRKPREDRRRDGKDEVTSQKTATSAPKTRSWGRHMKPILWEHLQEEPSLPTPWFQTSHLPNSRNTILLFEATQFVVIRGGNPRKQTQSYILLLGHRNETDSY